MKKHLPILLFLIITGSTLVHGAPTVRNSMFYQQKDSEYTVYYGNINLPAHGFWEISSIASKDIVQLYLTPPENANEILSGRRMRTIKRYQLTQHGRNLLNRIYWSCKEYALNHESIGPSSLSDLDSENMSELTSIFEGDNEQALYNKIEVPFVFLLPNVKFIFKENSKWVEQKNRKPLAVELRPYVDDGKHWIVYTDGSTHREPVDPKLVKKYGSATQVMLNEIQ
ncbi:MAG: hypothetical protein GY749_05555 [Desulfobacteraceae bacterium]|nr:hypothetical protein [Desulfobacteraceae bacterium]